MGQVHEVVSTMTPQERKQQQERQKPTKEQELRRIDPWTFAVTGAAIGSYHMRFLAMQKFKDEKENEIEDYIWYSAPEIKLTAEGSAALDEHGWKAVTEEMLVDVGRVTRSHALAFYKAVEEERDAGRITWSEKGYYFTQTEGEEACQQYIRCITTGTPHVLRDGRQVQLKANKTSWDNRFSKVSGIELADLPEISRSGGSKSRVKSIEMEEKKDEAQQVPKNVIEQRREREAERRNLPHEAELVESGLEQPTDEDLEEAKEFEEELEPAMAVETATPESELGESEVIEEQPEEHITVLNLTGYDENPERMSEDNYFRHINGDEYRMYIIDELPNCDVPIAVGFCDEQERYDTQVDISVNGTPYRFRRPE